MSEEVTEVVEEPQIDESTEETQSSTETETQTQVSQQSENMVPQSRFNEVIAKKNALQDRVNELESQIKEGANSVSQTQEKVSTLNDTIEDLKNQLTRSNQSLWRTQAAVTHGIPEDFRDRLKGDTEEEILADAESMAKSFPKKSIDVDNRSSRQSGTVVTDDKKQFIERQYGVKLGD